MMGEERRDVFELLEDLLFHILKNHEVDEITKSTLYCGSILSRAGGLVFLTANKAF